MECGQEFAAIVIIEDFVYNHLCWLNDILKDIRLNKQHQM